MDDKIFIKTENEVCMFCPSCGKETLYMNSNDCKLFTCSECGTNFAMMSKEDYIKLIGEKIKMKRTVTYNEKYWQFAREILLEIKKQQLKPLMEYPKDDGIAYNVALLLDKDKPIPIEDLGDY